MKTATRPKTKTRPKAKPKAKPPVKRKPAAPKSPPAKAPEPEPSVTPYPDPPVAPPVVTSGVDKTHVLMILDCSGSMESCREATVSGFNEQLTTLRTGHRPDLTRVTVVRFNHDVTPWIENRPLEDVSDLTLEDYMPDGNTAMYDAVGKTLTNTTDFEDTAYLVVILSDGLENASRIYTAATVARLLMDRQGTGRWTVVYLGANQDLTKIAQTLNIPIGNMAVYTRSPIGVASSMSITSDALWSYGQARAKGATMSANFYTMGSTPADLQVGPDVFVGPPPPSVTPPIVMPGVPPRTRRR